jgi:hypothetical protein
MKTRILKRTMGSPEGAVQLPDTFSAQDCRGVYTEALTSALGVEEKEWEVSRERVCEHALP